MAHGHVACYGEWDAYDKHLKTHFFNAKSVHQFMLNSLVVLTF